MGSFSNFAMFCSCLRYSKWEVATRAVCVCVWYLCGVHGACACVYMCCVCGVYSLCVCACDVCACVVCGMCVLCVYDVSMMSGVYGMCVESA